MFPACRSIPSGIFETPNYRNPEYWRARRDALSRAQSPYDIDH